MKRRTFLQSLILTGTSPYLLAFEINKKNKQNSIQLIRHATVLIKINNLTFLIDPMLSSKNGLDPIQNCGNDIRFPMVELPVNNEELDKMLSEADAIVITHTHRDHWDTTAQKLIDKNKTIFCQPNDYEKIKDQGFRNVTSIDSKSDWKGILISRTKGQHGTGEIGKKMGDVSGFVFKHGKESVYVAGDTIWCEDVAKALLIHKPKTIILNAGGAKFLTGDPITMTPADIQKVYEQLPKTKIIAVHMDTVNHCFIKRTDLAKALSEMNLESKVLIPKDGELIKI
ncbi:MAG: MBL fold metallo-hydrolase [Chitinophagaceae bacterium]|nr:MBL fold metallo-hydrolase [Chitinophagaceae bacterium]MDP1763925.1 MBL fold metallo-hydrolase [Sediminibacterium sp.]